MYFLWDIILEHLKRCVELCRDFDSFSSIGKELGKKLERRRIHAEQKEKSE
jgi:hypothetical protein